MYENEIYEMYPHILISWYNNIFFCLVEIYTYLFKNQRMYNILLANLVRNLQFPRQTDFDIVYNVLLLLLQQMVLSLVFSLCYNERKRYDIEKMRFQNSKYKNDNVLKEKHSLSVEQKRIFLFSKRTFCTYSIDFQNYSNHRKWNIMHLNNAQYLLFLKRCFLLALSKVK